MASDYPEFESPEKRGFNSLKNGQVQTLSLLFAFLYEHRRLIFSFLFSSFIMFVMDHMRRMAQEHQYL